MVERRNQTIVGMARSMLKAKKLPAAFWGEMVSTVVFILNRSPTKSLKGTTPFEAWHGRKPNVSFLRTFECVGHVKETRPGLKLDDRSRPMVFLGYEPGKKAYRLYDPQARRIVVSCDVIFNEAASWDWESGGERGEVGGGGSHFTVEYEEHHTGREGEVAEEQGGASPIPGTGEATLPPSPAGGSPVPGEGEDGGEAEGLAGVGGTPTTPAEGVQYVTPPPVISPHLDASYDGEPVQFRYLDNYIGGTEAPGLAAHELGEQELHLGSGEEPATFKEAEQDPRWRQAMVEEMASIEENKTWALVNPPAI
ncbi:hypothetical protein SEVIR_5G164650v4 [Setaria viridis]